MRIHAVEMLRVLSPLHLASTREKEGVLGLPQSWMVYKTINTRTPWTRLIIVNCELQISRSHLVEFDLPVSRELGLFVIFRRSVRNLVGGSRSELGEKPLGSIIGLIWSEWMHCFIVPWSNVKGEQMVCITKLSLHSWIAYFGPCQRQNKQ